MLKNWVTVLFFSKTILDQHGYTHAHALAFLCSCFKTIEGINLNKSGFCFVLIAFIDQFMCLTYGLHDYQW